MSKCLNCGSTDKTFVVIKKDITTHYDCITMKNDYVLEFVITKMCSNCGNVEETRITRKISDKVLNRICREIVYELEEI